MPNFFYEFNFYLFSLVAIASALAFVTRRSPVAAALWLVVMMFCLSALYVMLDAQFIGAIQVLVYAGAIMVVFLFVVMLLNLGQRERHQRHPRHVGTAGGRAGGPGPAGPDLHPRSLALPAFAGALPGAGGRRRSATWEWSARWRRPLFHEYLLAFELTSILLLVAIIGAVVIGKRRIA